MEARAWTKLSSDTPIMWMWWVTSFARLAEEGNQGVIVGFLVKIDYILSIESESVRDHLLDRIAW